MNGVLTNIGGSYEFIGGLWGFGKDQFDLRISI